MLGSCNDDLTTVGTTIQPPADLITVYTDTFSMKASSVRLDSVFAKTTTCMLGEIHDPVYGAMKADFLCQFYCQEDFKFSFEPYQGKIDSIALFLMYPASSWYGDSLTPMQVTVYPIKEALKKNFYTNENPEIYCDMLNPLGSKVYTAHDNSISDSIRAITNTLDLNYYTPNVRIDLPASLGQKFYDETVNNPSSFASQSAFNAFFPGLYVTTTYGSGNLLSTVGEYLFLRIYYNTGLKDVLGQDSLALRVQDFSVTKEVVQINRFKNSNIDELTEQHPDYVYLKSPAGVCAKFVLPTTEISKQLNIHDRYINGFSFNLRFLPSEEWSFALYQPEYLLLLPEDSVKTFFESGLIEDNKTSFISYDSSTATTASGTYYGHSTSTRTYAFGNISSLLKEHIDKSPDKDLSIIVIPVNRKYSSSSSSYYSTSSTVYTTEISHSLTLSGARIRTEEEYMKVVVLSSKFENN
jgi:hypothetical protein